MFDITPFLNTDDPWLKFEAIENIVSIYKDKYLIAKTIKPKSVLEVGVRMGYSAAAFLSAGVLSYTGMDYDKADLHGGLKTGQVKWAKEMLSNHFPTAKIDMQIVDTQQLNELPGGYDLIHVDADHSYTGCLHDVNMALAAKPKWILIDDIDWLATVKRAVCECCKDRDYLKIETLRGDILIILE